MLFPPLCVCVRIKQIRSFFSPPAVCICEFNSAINNIRLSFCSSIYTVYSVQHFQAHTLCKYFLMWMDWTIKKTLFLQRKYSKCVRNGSDPFDQRFFLFIRWMYVNTCNHTYTYIPTEFYDRLSYFTITSAILIIPSDTYVNCVKHVHMPWMHFPIRNIQCYQMENWWVDRLYSYGTHAVSIFYWQRELCFNHTTLDFLYLFSAFLFHTRFTKVMWLCVCVVNGWSFHINCSPLNVDDGYKNIDYFCR